MVDLGQYINFVSFGVVLHIVVCFLNGDDTWCLMKRHVKSHEMAMALLCYKVFVIVGGVGF